MSGKLRIIKIESLPAQPHHFTTAQILASLPDTSKLIDKLQDTNNPQPSAKHMDVISGQPLVNDTHEPWQKNLSKSPPVEDQEDAVSLRLCVDDVESDDGNETVPPCPDRYIPLSKLCRSVSSSDDSCSSDTVQPASAEEPKRSLNITDDLFISETRRKALIRWNEIADYMNSDLGKPDARFYKLLLETCEAYRLAKGSVMKHPGEDASYPENTIRPTLSRHEGEKTALKTQTTQITQTAVINANNIVDDDDDVACGKSSKQSEHLVSIINNDDVQSLKIAKTKARAGIENKPNLPKNIHEEPGPSSAVNPHQLTGSNPHSSFEDLSDRVSYPTKPVIISSVNNRDKNGNRFTDNDVCKNYGRKVIIQKNSADFQACEPNSTDCSRTSCTGPQCQSHKDYVGTETKIARLEQQVQRLKSTRFGRQNKSTAQSEDTTIKEHNIINWGRKRANNNVTEVLTPPMELRKISAQSEDTTIKEHNIINWGRKRANNNVTEVLTPPMELRKISAQSEDTTIKEHNIINWGRKRANNNVTEVLTPPMKLRKISAKSQEAERPIKGNARSLPKQEEESDTLFYKKLNNAQKAAMDLARQCAMIKKGFAKGEKKAAAQRKALGKVKNNNVTKVLTPPMKLRKISATLREAKRPIKGNARSLPKQEEKSDTLSDKKLYDVQKAATDLKRRYAMLQKELAEKTKIVAVQMKAIKTIKNAFLKWVP